MNDSRLRKVKAFMAAHSITLRAIGEQLDVTTSGAKGLLARDTIPTGRHAQLVALGFPPDILPEPMDLPPGPRPKIPHFPGLVRAQGAEA